MIYTSRFSNPALKSGTYTTVRISIGEPKFALGYYVTGEISDLMPFGLLNKYQTYPPFAEAYKRRLSAVGVDRIRRQLDSYERFNSKSHVVLLCFEDIRKPGEWCHRTAFAEWWYESTGVRIIELDDSSVPKVKQGKVSSEQPSEMNIQVSMF